MFKKLVVVFLSSFLLIQNTYSCDNDNELRSELKQIRAQALTQIPKTPDASIFTISEELAKNSHSLAQKVCNKLWSSPDFQDLEQNISVTLCGSIAWGEPTLKSDLEIILLLKNYQYLSKAVQFAKTLLSAFKNLKDPYFIIDEQNKDGVLPPILKDGFLLALTAHDAVNYAFGEKHTLSEMIPTYLKNLEAALNTTEGTLNNKDFQAYLESVQAIEFLGESLNVTYLSGNKEIFYQYISLRDKELSSLNTLHSINRLTSGLLDHDYHVKNKGYFEQEVKVYWRRISHVIRTLGLFTECSEIGSFHTLKSMKDKGFLSDETYQDLLKKAQIHVWARLRTSTGMYETMHVRQELLTVKTDDDYTKNFFQEKLNNGEWFIKKDSNI